MFEIQKLKTACSRVLLIGVSVKMDPKRCNKDYTEKMPNSQGADVEEEWGEENSRGESEEDVVLSNEAMTMV